MIYVERNKIKERVDSFLDQNNDLFILYKNKMISDYGVESKIAHEIFIEEQKNLIERMVNVSEEEPLMVSMVFTFDKYLDVLIKKLMQYKKSEYVMLKFLNGIRKYQLNVEEDEIEVEYELYKKSNQLFGYKKQESLIKTEMERIFYTAISETIGLSGNERDLLIKRHIGVDHQVCFFDFENFELMLRFAKEVKINNKNINLDQALVFIRFI